MAGDDYQLTAVDAGGMFRELAETQPEIVIELESNRRQKQAREKKLLRNLRVAGPEHADKIVRTYLRHGRVTAAEDQQAMLEQMVSDYWDGRASTVTETGRDGATTSRQGPPYLHPPVAAIAALIEAEDRQVTQDGHSRAGNAALAEAVRAPPGAQSTARNSGA